MGVVRRPPPQHLADGQELLHGRLLQDDPDALEHSPPIMPGVVPQYGDLAGARCLVALQDLDDRGLACAVRSEQSQDLAGLNFEIHAADSLDGTEVLTEP